MEISRLFQFSCSAGLKSAGSRIISFDLLDNISDLCICQFGKHRQRKILRCAFFGNGKTAFTFLQEAIRILQMNRYGIVNAAGDAFFAEVSNELVSVFHANGIDMIYMPGVVCFQRDDNILHRGKPCRVVFVVLFKITLL